jgi:hypothetical protein
MKLSAEQIRELQKVLLDEHDLELDNEAAQAAGLAIMRFIVSKHRRSNKPVIITRSIGDEIK